MPSQVFSCFSAAVFCGILLNKHSLSA